MLFLQNKGMIDSRLENWDGWEIIQVMADRDRVIYSLNRMTVPVGVRFSRRSV